MAAVRRGGKRAWTANIGDGNVTEFDLDARRTGRSLPAAANDEGIAATPGGILLWVGSNTEKTVTILDTEQGEKVATLTSLSSLYRLGISRSGRRAVLHAPLDDKICLFAVGSKLALPRTDLAT